MREHVVIVGSGMMGSGIAAMAALAGNPTILVDLDLQKVQAGRSRAEDCIALRQKNGLNTEEKANRARRLISVSTDIEEAAASARLVVEAIVENLKAK